MFGELRIDAMMIENLLLRCAKIVESFSKLPGAPTPQWCDRAASSLAPLVPGGLSSVAIVLRGDTQTIRETANIGAWSSSADRASLALRRLCRAGSQLPPEGRISTQPLLQFPPLRELASSDFSGGSIWASSHAISPDARTLLVVHLLQPSQPAQAQPAGENPETALAHATIKTLATFATAALPASDGGIRWLTRRESEVLEQLTLGYSIREIADLLNLSHHTVQDHVKHLHTKLDANNRGELVARALGRRAK